MQQQKSSTPWIVCGVIALVVLCGGFFLLGGLGLLAYIGGQATATPELSDVSPKPTPDLRQPAVDAPTAVPPTPVSASGDLNGIPYKAVVQILAYVQLEGQSQPGWSGSGSIISPDGLILTNAHVVLSDRYYNVDFLVISMTVEPDQQPVPTYIAEILQVDQQMDIAVIRVATDLDGNPVDRAALNLPTVAMGNADELDLGDEITILGYPTIGGSTITLTRGEVAGFTAQPEYGNRAFIKTSATISGGNSGGLAANAAGQLIGVPTQLGYGGEDQYVDCRVLVDTNRDGVINEGDSCVPTGGFINALRPLTLAQPYIDAAKRGEVNIQTGIEGQQGQAPVEEGNAIVFEDDFSDANSGWDEDSWDNGDVQYANGKYLVTVKAENWLVWSYHGNEDDDTIITVDAQVASATGVGDFGVMCRFVDDSNYYAFEVSEDGYFSIWKVENGENITLYDWTYSESIPVGGPMRIDTACVGNRLLLGVNDVLLAEVNDASFTSGSYGLIAGTLDPGGLSVAFDNFTVYEP
jgi:S1-C subfamily serine protease